MDASLLSDELIHLPPGAYYALHVCRCLPEGVSKLHRKTLKAALAQLQEKGMSLSMLVDSLKIREIARQDKIEETIKICF